MGKDFRGNNQRGRGQQRDSRGRGGRGGRGGRPNRGGIGSNRFAKPKQEVTPFERFESIFILKAGKDTNLVTKNLSPGESVYGEKRIAIENKEQLPDGTNDVDSKVEYRVWNAFRSKLGAAILNGVENIYMRPGSRVLYLGAANGTTISHVSDLVGESGIVYGVEISERSGRDLINMAKKRPNLVPIVDDARKPEKYRFLIPGLVDCIFADVAQPDQARIIGLNADHYLKNKGGFVFSIKANCVDSTAKAEDVFTNQINELKKYGLFAKEKVTLEPYERDHAVVTGVYKPEKKKNNLFSSQDKRKDEE